MEIILFVTSFEMPVYEASFVKIFCIEHVIVHCIALQM